MANHLMKMKVRTLLVTLSALLTAIALVLLAQKVSERLSQEHQDGGSGSIHDMEVTELQCRRSHDREFVADDRGAVCKWIDVDYKTGCCPSSSSSFPITSPSGATGGGSSGQSATREAIEIHCKSNCCSIYAYCIAACLLPENPIHPNFTLLPNSLSSYSSSSSSSSTSTPPASMAPPADKFDYCKEVCRTNSKSIINEKEWKSPLKYCFLPSIQHPTVLVDNNDQLNDNKQNNYNTNQNYNNHNDNQLPTDPKTSPVVPYSTDSPFTQVEKEIDQTLSQIHIKKSEQEELLNQLEQKIKQLVSQNLFLIEENKELVEQLSTIKGKLDQHKMRMDGKSENGGRSEGWMGLGLLVLLGIGLLIHIF